MLWDSVADLHMAGVNNLPLRTQVQTADITPEEALQTLNGINTVKSQEEKWWKISVAKRVLLPEAQKGRKNEKISTTKNIFKKNIFWHFSVNLQQNQQEYAPFWGCACLKPFSWVMKKIVIFHSFLIWTRFKLEGSWDFKIYILQIRNLFTDHKEKCPKFLEQ